jgi:hypothetical protein
MNRFSAFARIIVAMLREIFDESAYARFLQRSHMPPSKQSYAAFCRERDSHLARKPRCC